MLAVVVNPPKKTIATVAQRGSTTQAVLRNRGTIAASTKTLEAIAIPKTLKASSGGFQPTGCCSTGKNETSITMLEDCCKAGYNNESNSLKMNTEACGLE